MLAKTTRESGPKVMLRSRPRLTMPGFRTDNLLECSEETYWDKVFFDEEYNRRLFFDELHFVEWRELERKEQADRVSRVVKATPRLGELPGPLKALIGDSIGYEERGLLARGDRRYQAQASPNRMGDKVKVELTMSTTPAADGKCRLLVEGSVTARIFAVGSLLEQRMVQDLRRSYEKGAEFTNRFVAEKGWR